MALERFNPDHLVLAFSYADTVAREVLPFLAAHQQDQRVPGADGKPLFCSRFSADRPAGTVLIAHGFTENAFKFSEVIYSLLQNGLSVVAYDQRGHGRSWRPEQISDLSLTHVDHFQTYVRDMEAIVDTVLSQMPKPWMIFAHSMGGAVTCLYLEKHPGVFSRAALCAPMIQANLGMPRAAVKLLCNAMNLAGKSASRVFVSKPYREKEAFETSCANGRERFDWYESVRFSRREFQNNGPTYGWTLESANVTSQILAPGEPEKITCPVRLYTASLDNTVLPEAQKAFIDRVKQGTRLVVDGAKHEIYRSADKVLFPWWHDVLTFLRAGGETGPAD